MPLRNAITIAPIAAPLLLGAAVFGLLSAPKLPTSDGIVTGGFQFLLGERDFNAPLIAAVPANAHSTPLKVSRFWERTSPLGAHADIVIEKSPFLYEVALGPVNRQGWDYLSRKDRQGIDSIVASSHSAITLRVHSSGIPKGSLATLRRYHINTLQLDDLSYHFVIGNGSMTDTGEIEVKTLDDSEETLAPTVLDVCLIGDFNADRVPDAQLLALDELVAYLRAKVDSVTVTCHFDEQNPQQTCLGLHFPVDLINDALN